MIAPLTQLCGNHRVLLSSPLKLPHGMSAPCLATNSIGYAANHCTGCRGWARKRGTRRRRNPHTGRIIIASAREERKNNSGDGVGDDKLRERDFEPQFDRAFGSDFEKPKYIAAIEGENLDGALVAQKCVVEDEPLSEKEKSTDVGVLLRRFQRVAAPYWSGEDKDQARIRLAGVFALTLGTTGISVAFNFLGRDFYNALASKDPEAFARQLTYYLGAFVAGIPVFVLRDYFRDMLALRWRAWMTDYYMDRYFKDRTFYSIQSQSLIDNPDQRMVDDLNAFTGTALAFSLALFNATIDLISFSGILYSIYPPLFGVLIVYSLGGTAISVALGKGLVGLNFMQEKREADFRYGLVRVRENAESIAFYGGEQNETSLLMQRFRQSFDNYSRLLISARNLDFFTSGYKYLIQLLPAAVVAPLYFSGQIEFGVINQSFSAFNHVLSDFSIIVYQFQALSSFSATVDRLGEFSDILDELNASKAAPPSDSSALPAPGDQPILPPVPSTTITLVDVPPLLTHKGSPAEEEPLLELEGLTVCTPQGSLQLVDDLSLKVNMGEHLLIMGPSGSGKTSLLRAIAGLWRSGDGLIRRYVAVEPPSPTFNGAIAVSSSDGDARTTSGDFDEGPSTTGGGDSASDAHGLVFFVPQRPYMVLGTLRQQLLYPTWTDEQPMEEEGPIIGQSYPVGKRGSGADHNAGRRPRPSDEDLVRVLHRVRLGNLMGRCDGLDARVEWASVLSLGEQQRLAFARLLLSRPRLALMDESTSALDEDNEGYLYAQVEAEGVTFVSVGHRRSLQKFHTNLLQLVPASEGRSQSWSLNKLVGLAAA